MLVGWYVLASKIGKKKPSLSSIWLTEQIPSDHCSRKRSKTGHQNNQRCSYQFIVGNRNAGGGYLQHTEDTNVRPNSDYKVNITCWHILLLKYETFPRKMRHSFQEKMQDRFYFIHWWGCEKWQSGERDWKTETKEEFITLVVQLYLFY